MIPDIAYLILNYNPAGEETAQEILDQTIQAFYNRKSKKLTCDVFLLDQGSVQTHRTWLVEKQQRYGFSTILLNRNIGISRAINFFVRTCKSPVIGLITSDVIITSGMDEDLYNKVQIDEIYQAAPFTDKSDVDYQRWQPGEAFGSDNLDLRDLKKKGSSFLGRFFNNGPSGYLRCLGLELNVMFWRRSVFDKVGYFDERWKACYENNDFSLRCFLAGGCSALSYNSFVWHFHKTTEKNSSREQCYDGYIDDWHGTIKKLWDDKWPRLNSYIDIYKVLKDKRISDFTDLYEQFQHNTYLPYEQDVGYF